MIYRNCKFVATALMALTILSNATTLAMSAPNPPAPADKVISIGEARSLPLGTVVTIDGSVTVPSGAFSSSTFDQARQSK